MSFPAAICLRRVAPHARRALPEGTRFCEKANSASKKYGCSDASWSVEQTSRRRIADKPNRDKAGRTAVSNGCGSTGSNARPHVTKKWRFPRESVALMATMSSTAIYHLTRSRSNYSAIKGGIIRPNPDGLRGRGRKKAEFGVEPGSSHSAAWRLEGSFGCADFSLDLSSASIHSV
jgi:hypothetical protein